MLLKFVLKLCCIWFVTSIPALVFAFGNPAVEMKDITRIEGLRDNSLVGYGIVVGLAGTGDSIRNQATVQSVANALKRFGVNVTPQQIRSRNVAAVSITATLKPFSHAGDKMDINVASMGDSRSLAGGTLLTTPLRAANQDIYALAQGPLSVGGFRYDAFGNLLQKNHPTVGLVPNGAIIEKGTHDKTISNAGTLYLLLDHPDFTTAQRISAALGRELGLQRLNSGGIRAIDAGRIAIRLSDDEKINLVGFVSQIEKIAVIPDQNSRVVINERTGTVVAGGNVLLGSVTITHGELRLSVNTDFLVSQPGFIGNAPESVSTAVVPKTDIQVVEANPGAVHLEGGTKVIDLVDSLNDIKLGPRDVIAILQAIKTAGALHAELVIQ